MKQATSVESYSSRIDLRLRVNGTSFELAQIGPDDVIVNDPVEVPPCAAEVIMVVDGDERRWPVRLVDGISSNSRIVRTQDI